MSYNPATDFLGLLRLAGGGVQSERMPGLDYVVSALSRMGFVSLYVGQAAPTVDQSTTVWLQPASPSWSAEGTVWLWNAGATPPAYQAATPGLWTTFLQSIIISPAMIPVVAAATLALARTAMGLGSIATQDANDVTVTGGTVDGVAITNGMINGAAITGGTINSAAITGGTINVNTITLAVPLAPTSGGTGLTSYGAIDGTTLLKSAIYAIVNADKRKTITCIGAAYYTVSLAAAGGYDADFQVRIYNADTRGKLVFPNSLAPFILWPGQNCVVHNTNGVWAVYPSAQRWKPATQATFYVNPAGSDSNDGLATGAANAFQTIPHAVAVIGQQYDTAAGGATIQLDAGTHQVGGGVSLNYQIPGPNQNFITGDVVTNANVIVNCSAGGACFGGRDGCGTWTLSGMTFQTGGNSSTAINCSQYFQMDLALNTFSGFPLGTHISVADLGSVDFTGNYSVIATAVVHLSVSGNSHVNYGTINVNIPNGLIFTTWVTAVNGAFVSAGGVPVSFSGAGVAPSNGKKFGAAQAGNIQSQATVYPGNVAGTADATTFAQYS